MTPSRLRAAALFAAASLTSLSSTASGQVAQSASVKLTAFVKTPCRAMLDMGAASWGPILSDLATHAVAVAPGCQAGGLSAFGNVSATWASAAAGVVSFTGVGFIYNDVAGTASMNTGGDDWVYTFLAPRNGTFSMNGNVAGIGDTFGLWGWALSISGGPEGVRTGGFQDQINPTSVWSFAGAITGGNSYTVTLANNTHLDTCLQCLTNLNERMNGRFDWNITQTVTTPEPVTLALVFPGLLAAAIVRRKRDKRDERDKRNRRR